MSVYERLLLPLRHFMLQCPCVSHRRLIRESPSAGGAMPRVSTVEDRPSGTEKLHVYLLGPPRVVWSGTVLSIPRRQVRALLYRLAAEEKAIPRECLCFHFWSDRPESEARRNLTHLLTHLRRALPNPNLLVASRERVGLNTYQVFCDLTAFTRLSNPDSGIDCLHRAVELYRGVFLTGVSLTGSPEFESWIRQRQRECERRYLDVLAILIERHTARQELNAAIACARRYLATDELAEHVHRDLIALRASVGDRAAALRQFERCAAVLERELGVRPLPETRAVYRSVLREGQPPSLPVGPRLSWATLPSVDVPLIGRDVAYQRLTEALSAVEAGRSRVVLISGEPGIGKSRLLEAFATGPGGRALTLAAVSRSGEGALPYQPIVELFRCLPDWDALASSVEPVWLAEAARLLPELRELCPRLPPSLPMEPKEAHTRLMEALCRLMLALTPAPRPLLLCLDDLHWADSATLNWLVCLVNRAISRPGSGYPILILATYRTAERGAVQHLRHNLFRLGVLSEIHLTGLTPRSIVEVVRHLTGARPGSAALAERLQGATGGNPFLLLEMLRALLERGLPEDLSELQQVPLPETVRQAVTARLRRLDPCARQVLEAGAVLVSFDFDLVRRTAGRGEIETVDGLDEALVHQLLVQSSSGYRFRHALIRQIVEATLSPVRHRLLHRRAARALEQIAPENPARIARHFDRGGNAVRALHFYGQSAEQAKELFAWPEAEEIQSRMLKLLDSLDPDCLRAEYLALRGEILTSRASVRFLQGRLDERDADLAALMSLAQGTGNQDLHLEALLHEARYLNLDARYEDAIRTAESGLKLASQLARDDVASCLLTEIGFAHYFLGQPQQAMAALESALSGVGDEGSPAMRGRIARILGYVYFHLGARARSLTWQQEAYTCHQAVGDQNQVAWDGLDIGALHLELGDFNKAKTYLTEHLALARRIGARPTEAYGLTQLGSWELHRGAYLAAFDRFQEAESLQERLHSEHGTVAAQLGAGLALYHLGSFASSRCLLGECIRRARSIAHRRRLAECLVALGLLETQASCAAAAHSALMEAVETARDAACCESVAAGCSALARLERTQGDLSGALERAGEAVSVARRCELTPLGTWAHTEMGLVLLTQGKPEQALEHTSRALEGLPRTHEAWIGTEEVHRAHARVLRALGRVGQAHEQAKQAEAVIQAKADRISDPDVRRRYLDYVQGERSGATSSPAL